VKVQSTDPVAASKHIEDCETCLESASAEVVPFSLDAEPEA